MILSKRPDVRHGKKWQENKVQIVKKLWKHFAIGYV